MFNSFKGKSAGGWKDKKQSYGGSDSRPKEMHDAVCAQCNKTCQVPFKPNGRKPVFCSDCFVRDENPGERGDFAPQRSFRDDRGGDRGFDRSFDRGPDRSSDRSERAPERPQTDRQMAEVLGEMRIMNSKLESILKALTAGQE